MKDSRGRSVTTWVVNKATGKRHLATLWDGQIVSIVQNEWGDVTQDDFPHWVKIYGPGAPIDKV